jgi:hypothetical protein
MLAILESQKKPIMRHNDVLHLRNMIALNLDDRAGLAHALTSKANALAWPWPSTGTWWWHACCMDVIQQLNKVSCSLSALTPSLAATWRPRRAATASPLDLRRVQTEEKPSSSILGDLGQ